MAASDRLCFLRPAHAPRLQVAAFPGARSFCGPSDGTADTASATATSRKCWKSAVLRWTTPPSIARSRPTRRNSKGACAGTVARGGLSGERDVSGEITRTGDVALRSALFQAATTALARRMGVVLLRMWRDGTEFRFTREPATAPDPA